MGTDDGRIGIFVTEPSRSPEGRAQSSEDRGRKRKIKRKEGGMEGYQRSERKGDAGRAEAPARLLPAGLSAQA
jgi:hypothetical protein